MARSLRPLKAHYFLHGFGTAPVLPFLGVMLRQLGVPPSSVAAVFAVKKISMQLLAAPVGGLMDRHPARKVAVLRLLLVGQLVGFYSLSFVPPVDHAGAYSIRMPCHEDGGALAVAQGKADPCMVPKLNEFYQRDIKCLFECKDRNSSRLARFEAMVNGRRAGHGDGGSLAVGLKPASVDGGVLCSDALLCTADCPGDGTGDLTRALNQPTPEQLGSLWASPGFYLLVAAVLAGGICTTMSSYFQDAVCQQMVEGTAEDFGRQRMWASVGWGLSAFVAGRAVDVASRERLVFDYSTSFAVFAVVQMIDVAIVGLCKLPPPPASAPPSSSSSASVKPSVWRQVSAFLAVPEYLAFLFFCAALGACVSVQLAFHFMLLEDLQVYSSCDSMKALKLLQGSALALNCLAETPVFRYAGRLISRFGPAAVMHLVLLLWAVRFAVYGLITAPWQTLAVELLGGVCVGLSYPVLTTVANGMAPEGTRTISVGLAYAVMDAVGYGVGLTVAGRVYESSGPSYLFGLFSAVALASLAVNVVVQRAVRDRSGGGLRTKYSLIKDLA